MQHIDPATSPVPEPDATGLLSERPLSQLLAHSLEHGLSGTFELADDPRQYALVVVDAGRPLRVWTSEPVSPLGQIFSQAGLIDEVDLGVTLAEVAATRALLGQTLLSQGRIDETQLVSALAYQRLVRLHHTFTFPPTARFSYYNAVDLVGPRPSDPDPCDPLPSIWRGIVMQPPVEHVRATMQALGPRGVRLVGALDLRAFREEERAAVESLRQWPADVALLSARRGVDAQVAELLLYFLLLTKLGELAEPVSMPLPSAPDLAPLSSRIGFPPAQGEYVRRITLSTRPPTVDEPEPSSRRASVVPPSSGPVSPRVPAPPASGPRDSFAPAAPLSAPLLSPSIRPSFAPPSSPGPVEKNPEAERALADAEMNFLLGDRHQSLQFVKVALEHQPKMPAALALFAALEASNVPKGQEEKLQVILKRLDAILLRDPTCRRAHSYRGKIRRRAGDLDGAIDDLRAAIEEDSEDVDAARELKIAEHTLNRPKSSLSFIDRLLGK